MNDFFEWFVPCFVVLSIFLMTFGFLAFLRFIHLKERVVLAEFGLLKSGRNAGRAKPVSQVTHPALVSFTANSSKQPLKNQTIQAYLSKALDYQAQIKRIIRQAPDSDSRSRLSQVVKQVDAWVEAIKYLAQRADHFQQDPLIQRDLDSVPQAVKALEAQLSQETEAANKAELERTLRNYQKQLASLEQLRGMAQRAEIQIESTLSSLGTIYSQLLTGQSANHVADYSQLSRHIDEEVHRLQDQLEALQEVRFGTV